VCKGWKERGGLKLNFVRMLGQGRELTVMRRGSRFCGHISGRDDAEGEQPTANLVGVERDGTNIALRGERGVRG
jgi:hypothetical protein